ncbi:MAG: NADP-dependent succinic semialdehyde dehydrogenase [Robiginitomaculum sp.]|nr:MAG: NADP-dependent succinic semialdehyde dehydrogenase [Robiginitomaculum sp.]
MTIQTINPATGQQIKHYEPLGPQALEDTLTRAHTEFQNWRTTDLDQRQKRVHALAIIIEDNTDKASNLMALEMGKTFIAAQAEMEKCIKYCQYMADKTHEYLADAYVQTEYKKAFTRPLPLGPVLLVMPWNFPFWQVIRVAVPAILAGNTIVLKHASNVPQCALLLEKFFAMAGFSAGVFQTLLINAEQVDPVIRDDRIKAVSLTGSEAAGIAVAQACGKHIKKCVLELGGSDPFIVMPSANIEAAIDAALISRMRNNGQSCIAAKRMIVHEDIYEQFRKGFLDKLNQLRIGDPLAPLTDIGPLSSAKAMRDIQAQIKTATDDGAQLTTSTQPVPKNGYYQPPALLENITADMRIFHQEIFGPIAMFFKVRTFTEAINLANDTPFGLSSVLFSNDQEEIERAITDLEAGSTFVNRYASSDIRLPFGGSKRSGYGREMAKEGLREFTNLKTVIIAN